MSVVKDLFGDDPKVIETLRSVVCYGLTCSILFGIFL